jgi:bis(5'-nucleosyl)-tetraphosphatase (symmetrical)
VLGNHDLSLLAIAQRSEADQAKVNPDLRRVLFAATATRWWTGCASRQLHARRPRRWASRWCTPASRRKWTHQDRRGARARGEERLRGDGYRKLLKNMYGDKPVWNPKLTGADRFRAIVNIFTRMRYCTPNGRIGFEEKGRPGTQKPGLYPWFDVPGHAPRELPVVCGHWSTLGLFMGLGIYGIDTGAVWGGKLTALELGQELRLHQVPGREVPRQRSPPRRRRASDRS